VRATTVESVSITGRRVAAASARSKAIHDAELDAKRRAPLPTASEKAADDASRASASFERIVAESKARLRETAPPEIADTHDRLGRILDELRLVANRANNAEVSSIVRDILHRRARLRELHLEGDLPDLAARLERDKREVFESVKNFVHRAAAILGPD
jgi:hypothetical protein